jgi:UDP-N-acetylglucosamine 4,6-dehydratase
MTSLNNKVVLITGGTGSFGQKFVETMLKDHSPAKLIVFSRDELKQFEMTKRFRDPRIRFFLGDIRDKERLHRAFHGVDVIVHAAALKQVPMLEYNPFEAIKTNIMGAQNIIDAAIDNDVERVLALSTDKAVNPINLYGASKLCMEKLFVDGNAYAGGLKTRFSVVRYGNVVGSRGSVIPIFLERRHKGVLYITDARMSRFWLTLPQGVEFVLNSLEVMHGGEIFVPKIPSMRVTDLASALAPDCKIHITGIRPGEKLSEVLLTEDESRHATEFEKYYVVLPEHPWWDVNQLSNGKRLQDGFRYESNTNTWWLNKEELLRTLEKEGLLPNESNDSTTSPVVTSEV